MPTKVTFDNCLASEPTTKSQKQMLQLNFEYSTFQTEISQAYQA